MTLLSQAPVEVLEHELGTGRPLTIRAQSGVIAHFQRREDDCLAAAVATLLQVAYGEVPDPRIDERLAAGEDPDLVSREARAAFERWLAGHGLRQVPVPVSGRPPEAWIGVSPAPGRFQNHTVVMAAHRIAHDPASNWPCPPGYRVAPVQVAHGYTFEALEEDTA